MAAAILLASSPSPFWYASRSAGVLSLVLLTAVMVLGLVSLLPFQVQLESYDMLTGTLALVLQLTIPYFRRFP